MKGKIAGNAQKRKSALERKALAPEQLRSNLPAFLKKKADEARACIIMALLFSGSGHSGGSLSIIDAETALYFHALRHDPKHPLWEERDRLFVSGQHKCPAQYAAMGLAGYFPIRDFIIGLRALGTPFQGHPDWLKLPGIEMSGGSLGQGLGIAIGSAIAAKMGEKTYRVYCIIGDGEQQEGSVWEAAMCAAHYELDNLCAIIDVNRLQIDGRVEDVMNIEPLAKKYEAFGWRVIETDGHDMSALVRAFEEAKEARGQPSAIILRTIKGKGVSFMEDKADWHGKTPNLEQARQALRELGFEHLLTDELMRSAREFRENIARKYGPLISAAARPHWWNGGDSMKVKMI
ncbi:transketolase, partial [Candidatus Peregrinibacteria bacterium]|nr:transketolase [Candidatus Peregrinibacteria bacterium]